MDNPEIWKYIEGYEGLYKISNFGAVQSIERTALNNIETGRMRKVPGKLISH